MTEGTYFGSIPKYIHLQLNVCFLVCIARLMAVVIDWRLRQISLSFALREGMCHSLFFAVRPPPGVTMTIYCNNLCAFNECYMLAEISIGHVVHSPRWAW